MKDLRFSLVFLFTLAHTAFGQKLILEPLNPNSPMFYEKKGNVSVFGVSNKVWEGPYLEEVFKGSVTALQCARKAETVAQLHSRRLEAAKGRKYWSILWVHKDWNNVIDPWLGDGRRSYDWLQITPYWKPDKNKHIDQSKLHITDVQPTDTGIYACILATYPPEEGIAPVVLDKVELISIYLLRVKSGRLVDKQCRPGDEVNKAYCQSGFERWTFNVYYPTGKEKGDVLFQTPCHADLFLTAITHAGVDPTFWSLGWQFVPRGKENDIAMVEVDPDPEMKLQSPVHVCAPRSPVPCVSSNDAAGRVQTYTGKWDLATAQRQAAQIWRARWLVLLGTQANLTTGSWQCWLQGLSISGSSKRMSVPVRWYLDEVLVTIIPQENVITWSSAMHLWRTVGIVLAPLMCLLFIMTIAVGRITSKLFKERIPTKTKVHLNVEEVVGKGDKIGQHEFTNVDPYSYLQYYLNRSGVESYHRLSMESIQRLSRRLSQAFGKRD